MTRKSPNSAPWRIPGLLAAIPLVLTLQACGGIKEVGLVADTMADSTSPTADRVAALQSQHSDLATAYNRLRTAVIEISASLDDQLCLAAARESRASLHMAQSELLFRLRQDFDDATDLIEPAISVGLRGIQTEIERQHDLISRQADLQSAVPLQGQYADIVLISLLSESASIRVKLVPIAISGLQTELAKAHQDIKAHVENEIGEIDHSAAICRDTGAIAARVRNMIGTEISDPESQYEVIEAYLAEMSQVSTALKLYSETYSIFGDNGLLMLFANSTLQGFVNGPGRARPANGNAASVDTDIRGGLLQILSTAAGDVVGKFQKFTANDLLQELGLDRFAEKLASKVDAVRQQAETESQATIGAAKSAADRQITNGPGR